MAHDARERHADGPVPVEVLDELGDDVGHRAPASPACGVRILNRSAGQLAGRQVHRRGLHPRPADVDAERLRAAHGRHGTPRRAAGSCGDQRGGRAASRPASAPVGLAADRSASAAGAGATAAAPGRTGRRRAGTARPDVVAEERLGLGQHVLRCAGLAEVDDDRAARRRRVDGRPRRRGRADPGVGRAEELGVALHPAVLVLPRREPVARVRRHGVPLGADGHVADVPRHRDRRDVAAVAGEDVRRQLGRLGVLHRGRGVLRPGVAAVAAPAAVEEAVRARRRRGRHRHRVVAARLHRPDRRQDRAELGRDRRRQLRLERDACSRRRRRSGGRRRAGRRRRPA